MKLGVIGYGGRIKSVIHSLKDADASCQVAAVADLRTTEVAGELDKEGEGQAVVYPNAEALLGQAQGLDGILIGTRCSSHTDMALKALPTGIPIFLEKPVSTTYQDLVRLKEGAAKAKAKSDVLVSFPLRVAPLLTLVKEIIDSGKIGTVENVQAVNNVPYGYVYYQNWYRDDEETGGLFLQKATHDFDYLNYVIGLKPVSVSAMASKQIFKGDKPAGLRCVDCDEQDTCLENAEKTVPKRAGGYCCFAVDTGNEDSSSALVRYESGMHLSYSQNFFARRKAASRGARFLGYRGTLEFDFYTNEVKVYMHHSPRVETHKLDDDQAHFGGDAVLADNFTQMMQGKAKSVATLDDGLESALLCLAARESVRTDTFQSVTWAAAAEKTRQGQPAR